jgi:hypothetical protein
MVGDEDIGGATLAIVNGGDEYQYECASIGLRQRYPVRNRSLDPLQLQGSGLLCGSFSPY